MAGRVVVVQASSSEDETMLSPISGTDGSVEISTDATREQDLATEVPLTAGNKSGYRYDREAMVHLINHPSAKIRPPMLSPEFDVDVEVENGENGNGDAMKANKLWSPELWIQRIWNHDPRQGNSIASGSANHNWPSKRQGDHDGLSLGKKKQIDRLKSESEDGIVLSPQRRSFGAGCQVAFSAAGNANSGGSHSGGGCNSTSTAHPARRSASPLTATGEDRQQQSASHHGGGPRSSFRSRGNCNSVSGSSSHATQGNNIPANIGGNYGRGDRVENWRDRSNVTASSFGRGGLGKETPGTLTFTRSRGGGGANAWNSGSGRRSYGGAGGYHHDNDSLPEWVTEGPTDMFETMELRGFDEEERQQMQKEQKNLSAAAQQRRGPVPARVQQSRTSGGAERKSEQELSSGQFMESGEPNRQSKRDSSNSEKSLSLASKQISAGDIIRGRMPAEALVDGFDIGDMAQFLSVAGADFDSIANGAMSVQGKGNSAAGNAIQIPATSTSSSRFSKFFSHTGNLDSTVNGKQEKDALKKTSQQQQSVNIMELLSKVATATGSASSSGTVTGTITLPAGAKSLDEIEAAYKVSAQAQKPDAGSSSNKVLQELFQSASSGNASLGGLNLEMKPLKIDQGFGGAVAMDQQAKVSLPSEQQIAAQQAAEQLMKASQNFVGGGGGGSSTKGNPLADPNQQQHLLEELRKLHVKQQMQSSSQPHGDPSHRHAGTNEGANAFMAQYPQLGGLQQLFQQQAMQLGNFQATLNNGGRVASPLGIVAGIVPGSHHQAAPATSSTTAHGGNPAFAGFLPPANVPPPPITQQDLLLAHTQSIYQRALMNRKMQQDIEDQQLPPKPSSMQPPNPGGAGKLPTAFLPTSVIKQMHGGVKTSKDVGDEGGPSGVRPIVKQNQLAPSTQQEQVSPNSMIDNLRNLSQPQGGNKLTTAAPVGNAGAGQSSPLAPPPSLTPQELQRLIDQTHLQQRQQRQHQERVLLEQYAKTQQQQQHLAANNAPAATAGVNPAAVSAALALQNNPMIVQMLRARAIQAQQVAMMQQQAAAAAAGSNMPQAPPPPIPATAAVSAIPTAAHLIRARLGAPAAAPPMATSNPELMRHVLQQQQQQMLLNQLRHQVPDVNLLLNRLLTGQAVQQHQVYQTPTVLPPPAASSSGQHPGQVAVDAKAITLEELERLHKQAAAMQQPQ